MNSKFLLYLGLILMPGLSMAQKFEDQQLIKVQTGQLKSLQIYNHVGAVTVRGVDGNEASIKVTRVLKSSSRDRLEKSKEEIYLDSLLVDGRLYFFIAAPDRMFRIDEEGYAYYNSRNNNDRKSPLRHFELDYEFTWEVSVPRNLELHAVTHEKDLHIKNFQNRVVACNHHDKVVLTGMSGDVKASSHHGDVTVSFDNNPPNEITCDTHHGDIKITVQDGLSGDVKMQSHHGSFYTDFDYQLIPLRVSKETDGRGTRYKLGNGTQVRIGDGAIKLDFDTHHGDVIVARI